MGAHSALLTGVPAPVKPAQNTISASTSVPWSFSRPRRPRSSTTNKNEPTVPCCFSTSRRAAAAVPPVASRSSTITTFSPGRTASTCASSVPVPYSIALDDQVLGVVRVHADQAVRVPDEHQVAVAALLTREQHLALPGREHRR